MAAIIPVLLGSFALGATGGFAQRRGEIKMEQERAQRSAFLDAAREQAAAGNASFFDTPEVQKAFKRFGAEEAIAAYAQVAQAPLTQEQRSAMLAGIRAQRQKSETEETTERFRGQVVGELAQPQAQAQPGSPLAGEEPRSALQRFEGASPETQALISPPAATARVQREAGVTVAREEIAARKEISTAQIQARAAETAAELRQRAAELEEKKRTGVAAEEQVALRREETAVARERNRLLEQDLALNRRKLDQADAEMGGKIAEALFGEGVPARASKEISDYFLGRKKEISGDLAKLVGMSKVSLTASLDIFKDGHRLRKEALQTFERIIDATRGKKGIKLSAEEKQSMIDTANNQLREAYSLLTRSGFLSPQDAQAMLNQDLRVFVPSTGWFGREAIVSPGIAGSGAQGLSPAAAEVLRRLQPEVEP